MKKVCFYLAPFLLYPAVMLALVAVSARLPDQKIMPYLLYGSLILIPSVSARFSPSEKGTDTAFAALSILAYLLFMFFVNFADAGETYARFDSTHALRALVRTEYLIAYALIFFCALLLSCRPLRIKKHRGGIRK